MIINNRGQARVWVLRLMADNQIRKLQEIYQDVIDLAKISADEINYQNASGQSRVLNLLAWAVSDYTRAGILNRIAHSTYQISLVGLEKAQQWQNKDEISEKDFSGLSVWENYKADIRKRKQSQQERVDSFISVDLYDESNNLENPNISEEEISGIRFENQAQEAIKEIETILAVDLLNRLQQSTPLFFEKAVLKLLIAMGYGGKENLFEHTGKSHDGGIDGVIKQDPLGIQKIYIQAKRYASDNTIGRPELQQFVGVLSAQRNANAGVFITTSSFNKNALKWIKEIPSNLNVLLIDGQELVTLMIRYKVGIQVKEVLEICEIDEDFFE